MKRTLGINDIYPDKISIASLFTLTVRQECCLPQILVFISRTAAAFYSLMQRSENFLFWLILGVDEAFIWGARLDGSCRPRTVVILQSFEFRTRRLGHIHGCILFGMY